MNGAANITPPTTPQAPPETPDGTLEHDDNNDYPGVDCEIHKKGYGKDLSDTDRQRILVAVSRLKRQGKL